MGTFIENPVLQKELRSSLMPRRTTQSVRIATMGLAVLMVLLLYGACVRALLRSYMEGRDLFQAVSYIQLTLLVMLAPSLTANAITLEREKQTWNALLMSRLTPDEIVIGKLVARLTPALILLAIFIPLSLLAAFVGGLPAGAFFRSYLLLALTGVFYATIGLFCSWAYRRTSVSSAVSSAIVAFLVVGTPLLFGLWATARVGQRTEVEAFLPMWLNPYSAMVIALDGVDYNSSTLSRVPYLANLVFCAVGTLALLHAIIRRLSRGPKELEQ